MGWPAVGLWSILGHVVPHQPWEKAAAMKKHIVLLASVFVALGVTLGLAACGPNEEELIREQVAAELGRVSDASEENVRGLLGDETFKKGKVLLGIR